jgi:TolA-binding protein
LRKRTNGQNLPETMSHDLLIVRNVFLSLFGLGFIGWLFWYALKKSDDPAKMVFKILWSVVLVVAEVFYIRSMSKHLEGGMSFGDFGTTFMMAGSIVACGFIMSVMWTPHLSDFLISPLTNIFDGGGEPPEPKPVYSSALAKRKTNRPLEAIVAIREQLAKFPTDFEGIMLLANIQAEDMNDLPGAEITLNNFCNSPNAPDRQVVAALTQLADWHLKKSVDVDAARAALEKIVARFPDTEISLRAEQRLAHLGETEKILLAQHDRQAMAVPEGVKNIGFLDSTEFLRPKEIEPGKLAAVYVKHLEQHPHDTEVREKLAVIYARDFQRLDLATMELAQLINESKHKPKQVAHWLNLLANFQVELGADVATVSATLEQIVARFPDSPLAEIAQRRLGRINLEFKGQQATAEVKLGVYEQNLGLKYGRPRQS